MRAKLIDLGMRLDRTTVALLVAITKEGDRTFKVYVQLHPAIGERYLPRNIKLSLISELINPPEPNLSSPLSLPLASHASFPQGINGRKEAEIDLWNRSLSLDDFRLARWYDVVLSACETAIGDNREEMGFAGLAVGSGVRSALASLWKVNDVGTLRLMTEFYGDLRSTPIKAEALRQAQLAMLHKKDLPNLDLSHPHFWAGFTIIGSPW